MKKTRNTPQRTICRKGLHAMTPDNVIIRPDRNGATKRLCRQCLKAHRARAKAKLRKFDQIEPEVLLANPRDIPIGSSRVERDFWGRTFNRLSLCRPGQTLSIRLGRHFQPQSGSLVWAAKRTGLTGCYEYRWYASQQFGMVLFLTLLRVPVRVKP